MAMLCSLRIEGKLPAAKLCSMTTMLNADTDNKSVQTFRLPLEIVRDDPKHQHEHCSSMPTYGGDLLLTVTYRRHIVQVNKRSFIGFFVNI
jgi:hypothetical protein